MACICQLEHQLLLLHPWLTQIIDSAPPRFTIIVNTVLQAVTSKQLVLARKAKTLYNLCRTDLGEMKW